MIVHTVEQGSQEWHDLRLGIPTASEFDSILTPATMKPSKSMKPYAIRLVAEKLLGRAVIDLSGNKHVERGKELEPDAARMYEFSRDVTTSPVGFITTDDGKVGASPDRLVDGQPGAVELKCPAPYTHVGYLLDGFGADYRVQVQGQMLVGGFEWVDRMSFHPELPPRTDRTYRDEAFIKLLADALDQFLDLRDELLEQALAKGAVIHVTPTASLRKDTRFLHTILEPGTQEADEWIPA